MTHRQQKLPLALRITAAGCIALWLVSVSACSLKALFCCDSHHSESVAHADHERSHDAKDTVADMSHAHDADVHNAQDADNRSPDSDKRDSEEGACCSSLNAVVPTVNPIIHGKLTFHPIPFLCVFPQSPATLLTRSEAPTNRQAKERDLVRTPVVCLGPAHRSLAPPSLA